MASGLLLIVPSDSAASCPSSATAHAIVSLRTSSLITQTAIMIKNSILKSDTIDSVLFSYVLVLIAVGDQKRNSMISARLIKGLYFAIAIMNSHYNGKEAL